MNILQWLWTLLILISILGVVFAILIILDTWRSKQLVGNLLENSLYELSPNPINIRASIFTVSNDGMLSTYRSTDNEYNEPGKVKIPLSQSVAGQAWFTSRPAYKIYSKDAVKPLRLRRGHPYYEYSESQVLSILATPIINSEREVIGVLVIEDKKPLDVNDFSGENRIINITQVLANHLSNALTEIKLSRGMLFPKRTVVDDMANDSNNEMISLRSLQSPSLKLKPQGFSYTNKRGVTYFLYSKTTSKRGKVRTLYFFSKEKKQNSLDSVPHGYHVGETANGLPVLKKS